MKPVELAPIDLTQSYATEAECRASWIERRKHAREPMMTAGVVFPVDLDDDDHRRSIFVHNVSCGGVGFRSQTHFQVGGVFQIRIGAGPLQLGGTIRVVSCRPRPDGNCDVGAEFA